MNAGTADSLGARLRRRREERGIALGAIAAQTKIKASLFEALERDDVRQWPAGIFRRAFVRAYAHAIGLDPEPVVREFLERFPDEREAAPRLVPSPPPVSSPPPVLSPPPVSSPPLASSPPPESSPPPTLPQPVPTTPKPEADLVTVADLCARFNRVETVSGVRDLLKDAAAILHATGVIVWVWDTVALELKPALAWGYPDRVMARLPRVKADEDNPTAAAFRSAEPCAVNGVGRDTGALAVPLLTPWGCTGVLAVELESGSEPTTTVRAVCTILASLLAPLTTT